MRLQSLRLSKKNGANFRSRRFLFVTLALSYFFAAFLVGTVAIVCKMRLAIL
jgi:hypothetical protein